MDTDKLEYGSGRVPIFDKKVQFAPEYQKKTSDYMWWFETIVIITINVVFLAGFMIWVKVENRTKLTNKLDLRALLASEFRVFDWKAYSMDYQSYSDTSK